MRKLHALGAATALILSYTLPVQAEDCGRWVPCSDATSLNAADLNAYIYGNKTEIEPWITETKKSDQKVDKKTAVKTVKAPSAAPTQRTLGAAGDDAQSVNEGENIGDLTAAEENELFLELEAAEDALLAEEQDVAGETPTGTTVSEFGITGTTKETGLTGVKVLSSGAD
ncbi:hypothetical protein ACGYLO_12045 [Sulfitobacter sp. 1A13353]|uniref:hypothetical protein n=1 Tax=Sulfitobacter sp. 1A13353 TaxID=3368568 RepID=UPI003745AB5E